MDNVLKFDFALCLAIVINYWDKIQMPFVVLFIVMIIDYITGITKAKINHKLNSRIGVLGIVKKCGYLLLVVVGVLTDFVIYEILKIFNVEIFTCCFGVIVAIWLIINELISIVENIKQFGTPIPTFLTNAIKKLKKEVEKNGK